MGNIYVASKDKIVKMASEISRTVVVGDGSFTSGDGGKATLARLATPAGVAQDGAGNLYIADESARRIRKVTAPGTINTVLTMPVYSPRGVAAAAASLNFPRGVSVDAAGNLWIADSGNHRVRKINPAGVISTVAGDGTEGELNLPRSAVADSAGNVFISDTGNHRIRLASPQSRLRTVAGAGAPGLGGDGGAALEARLNTPMGLLVDSVGSVWIADSGNGR